MCNNCALQTWDKIILKWNTNLEGLEPKQCSWEIKLESLVLNAFHMPQMYLFTAQNFIHIALAFCSSLGKSGKEQSEPHIMLLLPINRALK